MSDLDPGYADRAAERERLYAESIRNDPATRALAVTACQLCDDDGYRNMRVCDHQDHTETNARGIAAVRAALTKAGDQ